MLAAISPAMSLLYELLGCILANRQGSFDLNLDFYLCDLPSSSTLQVSYVYIYSVPIAQWIE